jgi:cephalosporin hydroxylase
MSAMKRFEEEKAKRITSYALDSNFQSISKEWIKTSMQKHYVYNFSWTGLPIIQYPQDIMAVQELIWAVKPDLVIETGIAHGGSLMLSASILALLDINKNMTGPSKRKVLGVDIDIRSHNKEAIESHPLSFMIDMIQGSSVDPDIISQVKEYAKQYKKIMVFMDSMHTHEHVMKELEAYASLVTTSSYCVVFDTFVEDMNEDIFPDRPWNIGDNPKTAVHEFLKKNDDFVIDTEIENKLLISVAPNGWLKRT